MNYKRTSPMTWDDSIHLIDSSYRTFRRLIKRAIKQKKLSEADRARLLALMGKRPMSGRLRFSDLDARREFANLVAAEVKQLAEDRIERSFFHLTLLADEGIMSDRTPKFDLKLLSEKATRAARAAGLEAIFTIEVQPLTNWPGGGKGRSLLCHVHIVGWVPKGSACDSVAKIRKALGAGKKRRNLAWSCRFGAKPILVKRITARMGCPSYWGAYILKGLKDAKKRIPRSAEEVAKGKSPFKFLDTVSGLRPEFALRAFEMFAQLPLFATIGGVGEGAAVLRRCKNRLSLWDAERQLMWAGKGLLPLRPFDDRALWALVRQKGKTARYDEFFIYGPSIRRPKHPPGGYDEPAGS